VHFCTEKEWRWCTPVVTSPLSCIPTDDMGRVASIAIDLGLCCRFYSDSNCSQVYRGWGILGAWYPGNSDVGDYFKATVGSFQCLNSTLWSSDQNMDIVSASQSILMEERLRQNMVSYLTTMQLS
ncbi:hypothetical protein K469DRAFT_562296, partial [Zopfia rhizophila CBS 207.26]